MAEPKKKRSRTRTRRARERQKTTIAELISCPQCRAAIKPHMVCPHCGYYRGVKVGK